MHRKTCPTQLTSTLALFSLTLVAPLAGEAFAQNRPRTISVAGEGRVSTAPDMATIRTGVVTQADTAKDALDQNNAAMQRIMDSIKAHAIAAKDVQTTNFNVSPILKHDEQGRAEPTVVGYRVHNEVQVRVRNLSTLGAVLDALVAAGSNQVHGIAFDVGDRSGILNEARSAAIRNAKARAEIFAQAAGVTVGKVLQISEQPLAAPQPMQLGMQFRTAAASVPIATGEQEFSASVNVSYELLPPADE